MSKPVTDSALATAWPGSGLPNTAQSRTRPRQEDEAGDDGHRPIRRPRAPRLNAVIPQATISQARPSQIASLRVSAARPISTPSPISRGSVSRPPRGSRTSRVISRQADSARTVNGIVESGSAEWSSSGR